MILLVNTAKLTVIKFDGRVYGENEQLIDSENFMQWFGDYASKMPSTQSEALALTHFLITAMHYLND